MKKSKIRSATVWKAFSQKAEMMQGFASAYLLPFALIWSKYLRPYIRPIESSLQLCTKVSKPLLNTKFWILHFPNTFGKLNRSLIKTHFLLRLLSARIATQMGLQGKIVYRKACKSACRKSNGYNASETHFSGKHHCNGA